MALIVPANDMRVVAVLEALAPFAWRSFTVESVCRRGVAAMDGVGAFIGDRGSQRLHEDCVAALVEIVGRCHWRSLTAGRLSRLLVDEADAWHQEQVWFDIQLGMLLDGID